MSSVAMKTRYLPFLIFLLALTLRAAYYLRSEANPFLSYPILDESYYIDMGRRIANGFWLGEGRVFFMDPLYGYLLGLVFRVFGESLHVVRVLQIALDAANAVMIFFLGKKLWSLTAGVAAGLLYAAYKVSFFYSLLVLKTTSSITFLLLFVIFLLHVARARRAGLWFILGAYAAVMVYLQANLLTVAPLSILFYWFLRKPKRPELLKHVFFFAAGVVLFLAPGAFRNHIVSGEWIWMNTQSGRLLYSSNNPDNLTGRYNVPPFARPDPEESETDFHREAEKRAGTTLSAGEVSRYWRGQTWAFLKDHPRAILTLLKNKTMGTIADHEIPVDHSFELGARLARMDGWPLPTFALVFGLGVPGLALGLARRRETAVLTVPILTVMTTVLLFYTSSRFRMPAVPFLAVGAGVAVDRILHWIAEKKIGRPLGLLLASLALYVLSIHGSRPIPTGTELFYLSKAYWSQGRYEEARSAASEGMRRFPSQARFPVLLGMVALSQGRLEEAIQADQEAIRLNPDDADAHHNLGLACLLAGRAEEAEMAVGKAIALSPNGRYFFTLAKACESLGKREEAAASYREYLNRSKASDPFREDAERRLALIEKSLKESP